MRTGSRRHGPGPRRAPGWALGLPLLAVVACLAGVGAAADDEAVTVTSEEALAPLRELAAMFYDGELEKLHAGFHEGLKKNITLETLQGFRKRVEVEWGPETEVVEETVIDDGPYRVYTRTARFKYMRFPFKLSWSVLREDGRVAAFFVKELVPPEVLENMQSPVSQGSEAEGQPG